MNKKKKVSDFGYVYSTDPDFMHAESTGHSRSLLPQEQRLAIRLETKHRAGKTVTVVDGFAGKDAELQELVKKLKILCGTGGSAKDGEMIIQGDHREKIARWLEKEKYGIKKK